ncbi:MAG: HAD-superfamily hydrolase, subfamily variant 3 [Frankiales bacterium]|nr:HAD-superfamily hydrolase, subfamily variant 3 [Frankiales bacterium]
MRPDLGAVKALLCDADGNLFPSEEPAFAASAEVTNAFLRSLGIERSFTAEELRLTTTGKNFRTTAADLVEAHGQGPVARDVLEHWVEQERRLVGTHLGEVLRPDRSVLGPLGRLADRFVLAAVSSSATARLMTCLRATGLDRLIDAERVFSAESSLPVPTSKPHPAVYVHACEVMGLRPEEAVAVEDSLPGTQSAVAAGVPTIGNLQFVPEQERAEREQQLLAAGAFEVVASWSEIEQLLA